MADRTEENCANEFNVKQEILDEQNIGMPVMDSIVPIEDIKIEKEDPEKLSEQIFFDDNVEQLYADHHIKDEVLIGPEMIQHTRKPPFELTFSGLYPAISDIKTLNNGHTRNQDKYKTENTPTVNLQFSKELILMPIESNNVDCNEGSTTKNIKLKIVVRDVSTHINVNSQNSIDVNKIHSNMKESTTEKQQSDYFKCDYCSYETIFKNVLISHMLLHEESRKFACDLCGHRFENNNILKKHTLLQHAGNQYSCKLCNYKGKNVDLKEHVMVPKKKPKSYSCSHCDYKCQFKWRLDIHTRSHAGDETFSCTYCDYKSSDKNIIKRHTRIHADAKQFPCSHCECRFNEKTKLNSHMRVHSKDKPHSLECEFRCCEKSNLVIPAHEKPFSCQFKLIKKGVLKSHLRTTRPYSCKYCNYKCKLGGNLKVHMRSHTGERPYSCTYCPKKFVTNSSLKTHLVLHCVP